MLGSRDSKTHRVEPVSSDRPAGRFDRDVSRSFSSKSFENNNKKKTVHPETSRHRRLSATNTRIAVEVGLNSTLRRNSKYGQTLNRRLLPANTSNAVGLEVVKTYFVSRILFSVVYFTNSVIYRKDRNYMQQDQNMR